jgi:nucleotide-binding universal stress UspA family protein
MFRDLLVHVDGSDAGRRRLQFAIDLALRTGARLSGLHVMPPPDVPPLYKPSQLDEAVADMSRKLAANARAAREAFKEEVAQRLSDTRWFEADGNVADGICDRARYADLVILGQYEWQGPHLAHPLPIAHAVVLRCGRPVLVVPAAVGPTSFARAAIAWDGSREAVRAAHDALRVCFCRAGSVDGLEASWGMHRCAKFLVAFYVVLCVVIVCYSVALD